MDFVPFAILYGVVLGARHAFEPDHVAAVSTLAAHSASRREVLRITLAWGGGHAMAVILAGVLLTVARLPAWLASRAELLAGVTLIALGVWTVNGIRRRGLHAHVHAHGALRSHAHFHIHATAGEHEPHLVPPSLVRRPAAAYAIGTLHGLAGSGAAAALTTLAAPTRGTALLYLLCFGLGSLLGMAAVGLIALWPLFRMVTYLPRARSWIQGLAGIGSVAAGLLLITRVGIL